MNKEQTPQLSLHEHELKIWPEYFDDVESGKKTFEVRKLDRLFGKGDTLYLREWSPIKGYSGRETRKEITYVMAGGQWGLTEGNCILGIKPITGYAAKGSVGQQVDLNKLRDKFFSECVIKMEGSSKVCLAPHDLFEWFKIYITSHSTNHLTGIHWVNCADRFPDRPLTAIIRNIRNNNIGYDLITVINDKANYEWLDESLTSPATVSGDEINIEKSRIEGVLLGLKICKEMWAQGTMSHENIYENEVIYKEELKNILDKQTPVSGKEVEGVKFNVGDKINLNTGYSCDIGIVEKYENGIVYWKNSLGDTLYNTPVDKYNITIIKKASTPIKETVTDGVKNWISIDDHNREVEKHKEHLRAAAYTIWKGCESTLTFSDWHDQWLANNDLLPKPPKQ